MHLAHETGNASIEESQMSEVVLVTGCTGFIGKVVLAELLRRRNELDISKVFVLVRPGSGTAEERYHTKILSSECFRLLPPGWQALCQPLSGDVTRPGLGLSADDLRIVQRDVRRIIHCAASVDFNLPLAEAADINITGALHLLDLARGCQALRSLVVTSTAYVWPHPSPGTTRVFEETLVPLPFSATEVYQAILDGRANERVLLARTGHANTYSLTKCLLEHLVVARRGDLPLRIVRPSIVSSCLEFPFPGWIDSLATYAAFAVGAGAGALPYFAGDPDALLDIVPCDVVAAELIQAAFLRPARDPEVPIRHVVAGLSRSLTVGQHNEGFLSFFRERPAYTAAPSTVITGYRWWSPGRWLRALALRVVLLCARALGKPALQRDLKRLIESVRRISQFQYFVTRSFDFRNRAAAAGSFDVRAYVQVALRGMHRHLLRLGEDRAVLAGSRFRGEPPPTERARGLELRRSLRERFELVTFDHPMLSRAVAQLHPGDRAVVAASGASEIAQTACAYLCLARDELAWRRVEIVSASEVDGLAGPIVVLPVQVSTDARLRRAHLAFGEPVRVAESA
jgi:fatty acyl-CoA reductase